MLQEKNAVLSYHWNVHIICAHTNLLENTTARESGHILELTKQPPNSYDHR